MLVSSTFNETRYIFRYNTISNAFCDVFIYDHNFSLVITNSLLFVFRSPSELFALFDASGMKFNPPIPPKAAKRKHPKTSNVSKNCYYSSLLSCYKIKFPEIINIAIVNMRNDIIISLCNR